MSHDVDKRLAAIAAALIGHERLVADSNRLGMTAVEYSDLLWESRERVAAALLSPLAATDGGREA